MRQALVFALIPFSLSALAADSDPAEAEAPGPRYVLGAALISAPETAGASGRKLKLDPVWALQWGRWRITGPGGGGLLGFGRDAGGPGASREFIVREQFRAGVTLRIDGGRDSDAASTTRGLPDVRTTLRGRFYASWRPQPDVTITAAVSPDLLGRGGGLIAGLDGGWRFHRTTNSEWSVGGGLSWGDARYQRGRFGVAPGSPSGLRAFEPGAGLREVGLGMNTTHALDKHWFLFGGAGVGYLLGPAVDSPITQTRTGTSARIGLAWRS